jgi:hypothetical protein
LLFQFICKQSLFPILQALGCALASADQKWYNLRTTWMFNPLDSLAFAAQPRTVAEAEAEGWVEIDNQCDVEGAQ